MARRVVAFADLHISNALPFAQRVEGLITDRLQDTLKVIDFARSYAQEQGVTELWVPGDLLDRRLLDAVTLDAATSKLAELVDEHGMTVTLIPGNHEASDAAGTAFTLDHLRHLRPGHIRVLDGLVEETADGRVTALSYRPDKTARESVQRLRDSIKGDLPEILLLHQNLAGGKVGTWVNEDGVTEADLEGFTQCLAGHFHTPQRIGNSLYLGAPMQHHFADTGQERGIWDVTLDAGGLEAFMVEVPDLPRFSIFDFDGHTMDLRSGDARTPAYVEVQYKGTAAELPALRASAQSMTDMWHAEGVRLVKLRPLLIPTRKERGTKPTTPAPTGSRPAWPDAVDGYLDVCNLEGLERNRLKALAIEVLQEAEHG